jgi:hypothetical protein
MSYNIDKWGTKKLEGLKIPISEIHKLPYVEVTLLPENKVNVEGPSEGFMIEGIFGNDMISVSEINTSGEGSGNAWEYLIECLKKSTGKLIATQVWERGDSITRLIVENGMVKEENIEI